MSDVAARPSFGAVYLLPLLASTLFTACGNAESSADTASIVPAGGVAHAAEQAGGALRLEAGHTAHVVHECQGHADEHDSAELRHHARKRVSWHKRPHRPGRQVPVKLLGINDFHGQLSPRTVSGRPAGGIAVLSSYLRAAQAGIEDRTFIVHAGDHVGGSPPNSALLQDEPAITFLNQLTQPECGRRWRDKRCNVIGTLGNHEFDEGRSELLRLINGGDHADGPFLEDSWRGARYGFVSANVVYESTGRPLVPPYTVREVDGIPIAFIGAVLKETPTIVTPTGVEGLRFLDEADAINSYIPKLNALGIHTIIVQIHQGTGQTSYNGPTDPAAPAPTGALTSIIERLHDDVDVIVAGHTHQFTNALVPNASGHQVLVTQAFSAGTAFDEIDLVLDSRTRDVVSKSASIRTTWGDEGPGLTPDAAAAALVAAADAAVAPKVNVVVATAAEAITRTQNSAGESALGDLIAEAQRVSVGADFAVMNPGGIRADLAAGATTWGALFTVQPFGNTVVRLTLTGQQIYDLLNQQWGAPQPAGGRILQIAGFSYTWDSSVPEGGQRVVEVRDAAGVAIDRSASYYVAANNFIATGGDNFTVLRGASEQLGGPIDLDALIAYVTALPQPFSATIAGRITRL